MSFDYYSTLYRPARPEFDDDVRCEFCDCVLHWMGGPGDDYECENEYCPGDLVECPRCEETIQYHSGEAEQCDCLEEVSA